MSEVICDWRKYDSFDSDSDISVSGRIRLFNVWMAPAKAESSTAGTVFKHTDNSGSIALTIGKPTNRWDDSSPNIVLPKGGILFPDGLFVKTPNDASDKYVGAITLIYQRG